MDLWSYILPFISFIVDASIKKAYFINSKAVYTVFKVVLTLIYLVIYVLALQNTDDIKFQKMMIAN